MAAVRVQFARLLVAQTVFVLQYVYTNIALPMCYDKGTLLCSVLNENFFAEISLFFGWTFVMGLIQ